VGLDLPVSQPFLEYQTKKEMKGKFGFIVIFFLFISCSSADTVPKAGIYCSRPYSKIETQLRLVFCGYKGFFCGSRLLLRNDSSFIYKRLPFTASGIWRRDHDSLVLIFKNYHWLNDSLKSYFPKDKMPVFQSKPVRYKINRDFLYREVKTRNGQYFMEKLVFST